MQMRKKLEDVGKENKDGRGVRRLGKKEAGTRTLTPLPPSGAGAEIE